MFHKFTLLLAGLALAVAGVAQAADTTSSGDTPTAGEDYQVIEPALETLHPDKVTVTEVFSYACPHCAHFQPYAAKLKKSLPEGAVYVYKPAVFHKSWVPFARGYFTARAMGIAEESSQDLFDALHVMHRPISTLADLGVFYSEYGVDAKEFVSTAESFFITNEMKSAIRWERKANVRGTPTIIVDGKYRVSPRSAGGFGGMVKVARWLVNKELAANSQGQ